MATIGSLGVGSGLDLNGLLEKIASAERAPLNALKVQQGVTNARISAYGVLKSMLSTLDGFADKLADPDFMMGHKASSSATGVLTATSSATSVAGTYSVNVSSLAQSQSLAAAAVADVKADIGADAAKVTIDFGAVAGVLDPATGKYGPGATFSADAGRAPVTVNLSAGATSLEDIRDAINAQAAGAVTASIVNDGSGNRLVLSTAETGATSAMRISVAAVGAGALNTDVQALLGHDVTGAQQLRQTLAAQDAALTVNGLPVTSSSNTVDGAVQGVSMTLLDVGTSTLRVERDTAAVEAQVNEFIAAYNKLNSKIKELSGYDSEKKEGGMLLGDYTARVIQQRLRSTFFEAQNVQAGDPARLSDVGISFQKDGSLQLKASTFSAAIESNPEGVSRLFAGTSTTKGVADRFSDVIADLAEDSDGIINVAVDGAKKTLTRLEKDYARTEDRIDAKVAIIRAQFRNLDQVMSGMNATSSYLATQLAALSNSKSK